MPTPTDEQIHATDAFRAGRHLVLQAGAGTGKTATLVMLAAATSRRGRYLAFNKSIALDAAARFPRTVHCKTAHATAYAALGHRYTHRLNSPRQPAWKTGQALGITRPVRIGEHEISARSLSNTVLRTVTRFCYSADRTLARHHVPTLRRLGTPAEHAQLAEAPIRLTGSDTVPATVGGLDRPDAVLCRTNIGAMTEVMRLLADGRRVALARGAQALAALAIAARDLKEGRPTAHPELVLFSSWGELQEYAEHDPAGRDLQPFVNLVDTHGPDAILTAINQLTDEEDADVTVSTAHTAKGREWPTVRIADDFPPPKDTDQHDVQGRPVPEPVNDTDARLAYVAVTRARHHLDLGGLSWINTHPTTASAG
ncbi:3'-5' exonuclease [Streptomyces bottropensis]